MANMKLDGIVLLKNIMSCPYCGYQEQTIGSYGLVTCIQCHNQFGFSNVKPYGSHNINERFNNNPQPRQPITFPVLRDDPRLLG